MNSRSLPIVGGVPDPDGFPALGTEARWTPSLRTVAVVPASLAVITLDSAIGFALGIAQAASEHGCAAACLAVADAGAEVRAPWHVVARQGAAEQHEAEGWGAAFDERLRDAIRVARDDARLVVTVGAEVPLRVRPWLTLVVHHDVPVSRWSESARHVRMMADVLLADGRSSYGYLLGMLAAGVTPASDRSRVASER